MPLTVDKPNNAIVLRINGDLDAFEVQNIRPELEKLLKSNPKAVVMDLADVPMIDSSGIGLLVYAFKQCSARSIGFAMCGSQGQPSEMISFLKIDQRIPSLADVETALTSMAK
jgi:anti-sigma B factor antagonist